MKLIQALVVIFIVLVGGFFAINNFIYNEKQGGALPNDIKNLTFVIDGAVVTFKDGVSETEAAPGSASNIVTRYFGNEVLHDIDGDGDDDAVFLVTQETGGTGTFFYVVGAINTGNGYEGTQALFIGDRIAPQTTTMGKGRQVIVNYADREPGASFADQPSVGKSLYLLYDADSNSFGEVDPNFTGEATTSALARSFALRMFVAGTADGTIPIEGFDAGLLLAKFPGLTAEDFEGVEAFEGVYSVQNGEVEFTRTQAQPISSAERTVSSEGYATLLENVGARLEVSIQTEFSLDTIVTELYGKGIGNAKIGETVYVGGMTVTPTEVVQDSRCPVDAECIWEGTVVISAFTCFEGSEIELTLGTPKAVCDYTVTLVQVAPYPSVGTEIATDEYQFVFETEKN